MREAAEKWRVFDAAGDAKQFEQHLNKPNCSLGVQLSNMGSAEFEILQKVVKSQIELVAPLGQFVSQLRSSFLSENRFNKLIQRFDLTQFETAILAIAAVAQGHTDPTLFGKLEVPQNLQDFRNFFGFQNEPEVLAPTRPFRFWKLLHFAPDHTFQEFGPLERRQFVLAERILFYLKGVDYLPEQIFGALEVLGTNIGLTESHQQIATRAAELWQQEPKPLLQLLGLETEEKQAVAKYICTENHFKPFVLRPVNLGPSNIANFILYWNREAKLCDLALVFNTDDEPAANAEQGLVQQIIDSCNGPTILLAREALSVNKQAVNFKIEKPSRIEQSLVWQSVLRNHLPIVDEAKLVFEAQKLANQFHFPHRLIEMAAGDGHGQAILQSLHASPTLEEFSSSIWEACRVHARPSFESQAATRVLAATPFEDLILGEEQTKVLEEMMGHVRVRASVHQKYGFVTSNERGLGISCLFAGPSGTGKTTAAEALALELKLDLYRIDLSSMVSKYIGETEKNLRKIFDAAESGAAILLFDEADALFGKRGEVKDSHDRYANMEVSYLLQRMETYSGLAILTTNLEQGMDSAFMRRLRFTVRFDLPDATRREKIWQKLLPNQNLDYKKIASVEMAGGNIRNVAMNAAFAAEVAGTSLNMEHLRRATFEELTKLGRLAEKQKLLSWV